MPEFSKQGLELQERVREFMEENIIPLDAAYHESLESVAPHGYPPILDGLKDKAKKAGLWNMFIPHLDPQAPGTKLTNLDYAPISEQLGGFSWSSEVFNTIRLADEGVLAEHDSAIAADRPAAFRDPLRRWYGFAARARVIVYAPDRVAEAE